ncbi:MAG TPA: phospholipase D-like domain-containing protein [Terriglobales bacterium]|nr:phospholipase D-like domain-containing protein [Terriglobales bacterium]
MDFQLVDQGWEAEIRKAVSHDHSDLCIVCPFIQKRPVELLLQVGKPQVLRVVTRFNLDDFACGVSDTEALRLLISKGGQIRGVKGLHAKLYILGDCAISTSANLTDKGLHDNHEFGFISRDAGILWKCRQYFNGLWHRAGIDLTLDRIDGWDGQLRRAGSLGNAYQKLGDEGVRVWPEAEDEVDPTLEDELPGGGQAFVKFFGESENRAPASLPVRDEVDRSGSHWALTYSRRPSAVRDGATMFISRLVANPSDIVVYGRGTASAHVAGRDDATAADITRRPWKHHWPYYIRIEDPVFVAGILQNGISLTDLKGALGVNSFVTTKRNAATGYGNTDPNRAYLQQGAVRLTPEAAAWLSERFDSALKRHGSISREQLGDLDWPI